jgi:protein arginine N-methyltransferase 1
MIADSVRTAAYLQALAASIRPRDIVIDIGSGPAFMAMAACQLGAGHVYAIEPDESILVGQALARENGLSDRITFIQDISTRVTLPEKADVIVSDLRGLLPLFQQHIPSIIDARQRLLKPGGILIPHSDQIHASLVEVQDHYHELCIPWNTQPNQLRLNAALQYILNSCGKIKKLLPEQLLAPPLLWHKLEYTRIEETASINLLTFEAHRDGTAHGIVCWFDATLAEGITFTNAPWEPELIYNQMFFPFLLPLNLHRGDAVQVELRADLVGQDYTWSWKTRRVDQGAPESIGWDFEQSTFYSTPRSLSAVKKTSDRFIPHLSETGRVNQFILDAMDGERTLSEITALVMDQYPGFFTSAKRARMHVANLSEEYSS